MLKKLLLVVVLFVSVRQASAQSDPGAHIVSFSANPATVPLGDVEVGNTTVMLSWSLANTDSMPWWVTVEFYNTEGWQTLYEGNDYEFRTILNHPGNFAPPTFRLSVHVCYGCSQGGNGRAIDDEWILTIPYVEAEDALPQIETFTTAMESWCVVCNPEVMEPIILSWSVTHRTPTSNLVFDILPHNTFYATYPSFDPWIASEREGVFFTRAWWDQHRSEPAIRIRLRVIDVITGELYDEAEVTIPIVASPVPTARPTSTAPTPTIAPG